MTNINNVIPCFTRTEVSGMTKEQADQLILDAMSSSIYGKWILSGIAP